MAFGVCMGGRCLCGHPPQAGASLHISLPLEIFEVLGCVKMGNLVVA